MTEVRIGVIGNVDSGKSTLIGVLKNDILDNGRGSARLTILQHNHEKETGRTSSISKHYISKNDDKVVCLIDLAGHEKYLKTTLHGLSSHYTDYAIIVIAANMGVSKMTKEHLSIVLALKIKFIIVVSKIDIAPKNIYEQTIKDIEKLIKITKRYDDIKFINNNDNENENIEINDIYNKNLIPIFKLSNTTGENVNILKEKLENLNSIYNWEDRINEPVNFKIDDKFKVKGVGTVISGKLIGGIINKGDTVYLGPFTKNGKWFKILVKTIHNDFREYVEKLTPGMSGCLAIKSLEKKDELNLNSHFRKGLVIMQNAQKPIYEFQAKIHIMNTHSTTIKNNFQPIINCNGVVQSAIIKLDKELYLRGGSKDIVNFKFKYRPEYIKANDIFILREGRTRGLGKIININNDNNE